jgi:hypothetical protein
MPSQTWRQLLAQQEASASAFGTFTTAKTVINAQALSVLPAGFLEVGKKLTVSVRGAISNLVTTPGLIFFQVMLGSVIAFTTGNIQLNATAHTLLPFWLDIDLTCQVVGSGTTAKLMGQARVSGVMFTSTAAQTDGANTMTTLLAPATAPAQGTGFDSTAAQTLDFYAGFTISDAANVVRVDQYTVSSDN